MIPRTAYAGITDRDWFEFLSAQPKIDEVNFWKPRAQNFHSLQLGEPFLFKLKGSQNFIVGGGFFAHATRLPLSLAWDAFKEKNGVPNLQRLQAIIAKNRNDKVDPHYDPEIGCRLLTQPFFFSRSEWIHVPEWHPSIQQGKGYPLSEGVGKRLWMEVLARLSTKVPLLVAAESQERYGTPVEIMPRLGQGIFRVRVTDAYARRCALTGEKVLPVLQAAHIKPYSEGGEHRVDNGLLLRSDIHTLFDRGLITVSPEHDIIVSKRIKDLYNNGKEYYKLRGLKAHVPENPSEKPDRQFLQWHNETVYAE